MWFGINKTLGLTPDQNDAIDASGATGADPLKPKSYIDGLVAGLLDDRGNYDASGNAWPSSGGSGTAGAILKGDLWLISVAGTLGGVAAGIGDNIRALVDTPGQTASNWAIIEGNLGFVPENVTNKSTDTALGTSDTLYPSQKAIKSYADTKASGTHASQHEAGGVDRVTAIPKEIIQPATDLLTAAECSNTIINNYGQGAENTQTLPAAAAGLCFFVFISTAGAGAFHVKAGANDKIYLDGTALDDADKVSLATPAVGNCAAFFCVQTGASAYDWYCNTVNGVWSDGGA